MITQNLIILTFGVSTNNDAKRKIDNKVGISLKMYNKNNKNM